MTIYYVPFVQYLRKKLSKLLCTSTYGYSNVSWQAKTYIHRFCVDTGCCLEDLPRAMANRDSWCERIKGRSLMMIAHIERQSWVRQGWKRIPSLYLPHVLLCSASLPILFVSSFSWPLRFLYKVSEPLFYPIWVVADKVFTQLTTIYTLLYANLEEAKTGVFPYGGYILQLKKAGEYTS